MACGDIKSTPHPDLKIVAKVKTLCFQSQEDLFNELYWFVDTITYVQCQLSSVLDCPLCNNEIISERTPCQQIGTLKYKSYKFFSFYLLIG